ncbi:chemokine XC receptor 1-like [Onychostoma macrolepis]|uniref:chemokine XC receptor 1-like n=1 Tax=Onychostoma macrolepis TaxID=369639 RepID=UPI00272C21E9|nr:chemokine XC receptor 1-like [Onychostoma macrolepis]
MTDENTTYDYVIDYEDRLCRKEVGVRDASIPLLFISVVVLSCICDILVLVFLALYEKLRSLTSVFFLNLAVSNLLFTFGLLFHASYYWGWTFGEVGCKAVKFLFYVGFYSSVLFLTLMTVQRYMEVVHPLSDWERCRGLSVSPFIVWILSGTVSLLGSLHSKVMIESDSKYCEYGNVEWKSGIAYFQSAFFFIVFITMFFCYGKIHQMITKSQTNKRHKSVRLTFFIVLVFFIGWAPYNIVMFLKSLTFHPFTDCEVSIRLDYAEYYACRILAVTQCYVHTVAFLVFVDGRFRNSL